VTTDLIVKKILNPPAQILILWGEIV